MSTAQLLVFRLGREEYAIPIERVNQIINYIPPVKPGMPIYMEDIINVQGESVEVVDLTADTGEELEKTIKKIVLVDREDKEVGFIVDAVTEIIPTTSGGLFSAERIEVEDQNLETFYNDLQGRIIIFLDVDKALREATVT